MNSGLRAGEDVEVCECVGRGGGGGIVSQGGGNRVVEVRVFFFLLLEEKKKNQLSGPLFPHHFY